MTFSRLIFILLKKRKKIDVKINRKEKENRNKQKLHTKFRPTYIRTSLKTRHKDNRGRAVAEEEIIHEPASVSLSYSPRSKCQTAGRV